MMGMVMTAMERKVTKIGNSAGVVLTDQLKQLGIDIGENVDISIRDGVEIVIKKVNKVAVPKQLDKEFFEALDFVFTNYDETLKGLKNR